MSSSDDETVSDEETLNTSQDENVSAANTTQVGDTSNAAPLHGQLIENNPNDEAYPVDNARHVQTPLAGRNPATSLGGDAAPSQGTDTQASVPGGQLLSNDPADERVDILAAETVPTPRASGTPNTAPRVQAPVAMAAPNESESESEEEDEEDDDSQPQRAEGYAGQQPAAIVPAAAADPGAGPANALAFDPARYAAVNAKASREMQDLFKRITEYEPFLAELPVKLHPFIPEYIPTIGDLDPFVKVPRPDGAADGLGLYVVDEPSIPQSNPAVVLLELRATNSRGGGAEVVDSFEDAANRPEVLDRWIADIKKVHYKKPLPTVNYQKPMPDIEQLMQVWPQEFEDFLNSDYQFPPSTIDLDMEQYVRTLCAILDIPTYNSLIDSLHVMFTLYEEFRVNQHFQHE